MRFLLLIAFCLSGLLSACSYKSRDILFRGPGSDATRAEEPIYVENPNAHPSPDNVISVDDILRIVNLQNPELISGISSGTGTGTLGQSLNLNYRVESDSTVAVPVLGKVKLAGLTVLQAERKLQDLYKKEFLKDPIIDVSITNMKVTLLGEVLRQGAYELSKDKTNLVEVIGVAGGFTNRANKTKVKIIRGDKSDPEIIYVDMTDVRAVSSPLLNLKKDDIVYVEPNKASQLGDRLSRTGSLLQIALVFVNTALLIYTFSK